MTEKQEHRKIEPTECPRCHGHNVDWLGDDGTSEGSYNCLDCEKRATELSDDATYNIVTVENDIKYVSWSDENGDHIVYDSDYLLREAAKDLFDVAVLFEDLTRNGIQPGSEDLERLQNAIAKAKGESHE